MSSRNAGIKHSSGQGWSTLDLPTSGQHASRAQTNHTDFRQKKQQRWKVMQPLPAPEPRGKPPTTLDGRSLRSGGASCRVPRATELVSSRSRPGRKDHNDGEMADPNIRHDGHQASSSSSSLSADAQKRSVNAAYGVFSANNPKVERPTPRRESRAKHADISEPIVVLEKAPTSSPSSEQVAFSTAKNIKQADSERSRKRKDAERYERPEDQLDQQHDSKIRRAVRSPDPVKIQSEDESLYPRRSLRQRGSVPVSVPVGVFYQRATTLAVPDKTEKNTPKIDADGMSTSKIQKRLVPENSRQKLAAHLYHSLNRVQKLIGNARRTLRSKKSNDSDPKPSSIPSIDESDVDNDDKGEDDDDGGHAKNSSDKEMIRRDTSAFATSTRTINLDGHPSIFADKAPPSRDFMGTVEERVNEWLLEKHDNATQFIVSNEGLTDEHIWDPWFLSLLGRVLAENAFVYAIDLSRNHIGSIPEELFKEAQLLHDIQSLNLSNNNLADLPDSLVNLHNLTTLDLSHNKFSKLPRCVFKMKKLEYLYVGWNNLQLLPDDMFRCLPRLRYLEVQCNKLEALPEGFEAAQSLAYLDASRNCILYELPDSLNLVANQLDFFSVEENPVVSKPVIDSKKIPKAAAGMLRCGLGVVYDGFKVWKQEYEAKFKNDLYVFDSIRKQA